MICDLCCAPLTRRRFSRRGHLDKVFCGLNCVEAFEVRCGLPNGRIYEARPGWSPYPATQAPACSPAH